MIRGVGLLRSHSLFFNLVNECMDAGIILGSMILASIYAGFPWNRDFTGLSAAAILLHYVFGTTSGLYQSFRMSSLPRELYVVCRTWLNVAIVILILLFLIGLTGPHSRHLFLLWSFGALFWLVLWRFVVRAVLRLMRTRGLNKRTAVIVGAGNLGVRLARHTAQTSWTGVEAIGFFDDNKPKGAKIIGLPVLGGVDQLKGYLSENHVDSVYIALPLRAEERIRGILDECRTFGATIYLVPDLYAFSIYNLQLERFGDTILLNFSPHNPSKRIFDLCFSLCALIAALPAMLFIALAIKLEDGGPVFYGQRRVTRAGKEFKCLKFRTMCADADRKLSEILASDPKLRAEWERSFKLRDDPRVTRIGRLLRRTSLDELPQFFNVLKGEMSVVGARPIVEKELCDFYKENGGLYCSMKPGITGAWQTGKRSDTKDYAERVELDTWYVHNHSFLLDLKIILATIKTMFAGKGAY